MVVFFLAWLGLATTNEESDEEVHFTNSWAVHIDNGDLEAVNNIAQKHGFINQGQVGTNEYTTTLSVMQRFERVLNDFVFTKALILLLTIERLTYLFCRRVKRQDQLRSHQHWQCLLWSQERYQKSCHFEKINECQSTL